MSASSRTAAPTVDLLSADGSKQGSVDLDPAWFGVVPNVPVMHQVVTAQLAAARSGTAKTKSRGEVRGGGRKPWRQKGTGRARHGSIRAPQWAGGGVVHGPTGNENHRKRVPKKLKRLALASALSDRASSGDVVVVDEVTFEEPRTKEAAAVLDALDVADRRALLVLSRRDDTVGKSFRNISEVHLITVDQLNTYDVLASDVVVFEHAALGYVGSGRRADLAEPGPEQPDVAGTDTGVDEEDGDDVEESA